MQRRPSPWRRAATLLAAATAIVGGLYSAGIGDAPSTVGDRLGWRRFQTPAIEDGLRIGERFKMNRDGLAAVEVRPVATAPVRGRLRLALQSVEGAAPVEIRSAEVAAADFVRGDPYRFEFAPIADSAGRRYQVEISSSADSPSAGVSLWATKGERLRDGALTANGIERWADLAFQTRSAIPLPPPAWLNVRHPLVQLTYVALAVSWLGVVYALRRLVGQPRPAAPRT